jgi:hypothetical protein
MDKPMRDYVVTFNVIVHIQAQDEDNAEARAWLGVLGKLEGVTADVDIECVDIVDGED